MIVLRKDGEEKLFINVNLNWFVNDDLIIIIMLNGWDNCAYNIFSTIEM